MTPDFNRYKFQIGTLERWIRSRRVQIAFGEALLRNLQRELRNFEQSGPPPDAEGAPARGLGGAFHLSSVFHLIRRGGTSMASQLRALLVEDDYLLSLHVEQILSGCDCEVIGPASRLRDAVDILDQTKVDLAFLDITLRDGEKGYPIADELRRRRIPFAFLTAYHRNQIEADYRNEECLGKPVLVADIHRFVNSVRDIRSSEYST